MHSAEWVSVFNKRLGSREIVVWGTGDGAASLIAELDKLGLSVSFFISNNTGQLEQFMQRPVYHKKQLDKELHYVILGTLAFNREIAMELDELGFAYTIDYSCMAEIVTCGNKNESVDVLHGCYDGVFSLGYNCSVAQMMRYHEIRAFSGPFDWLLSPDNLEFSKALASRCQFCFEPEYMERLENHRDISDFQCYRDKKSGLISYHDIPMETTDVPAALQLFHTKFNRRLNRFFDYISPQGRYLFIRTERAGVSPCYSVRQVLDELGQANSLLLVVSESPCVHPTLRKVANNLFYYFVPYPPMHRFEWMGSVAALYPLLSGVSWAGCPKTNYCEQSGRLITQNANGRMPLIVGFNQLFPVLQAVLEHHTQGNCRLFLGEEPVPEGVPRDIIVGEESHELGRYYLVFPTKQLTTQQKQLVNKLNYQPQRDYLCFFAGEADFK